MVRRRAWVGKSVSIHIYPTAWIRWEEYKLKKYIENEVSLKSKLDFAVQTTMFKIESVQHRE